MHLRTNLAAIAVASVMVATIFTGCWGNDNSSSSSSAASSSSSTAASSSSSYTQSGTEGVLPDSGSTNSIDSGIAADSSSSTGDNNSSDSANVPAMAGTSSWELILVNAANPLPETFSPQLVDVPGCDGKQFDSRAVEALEQMLTDAKKAGQPLFLYSSYRSVKYQQGLFSRKIQKYLDKGYTKAEAEAEAAMWVARPGTSEHHLGLAADIVTGDWYTTHGELTDDFDQTTQYQWLVQNCANYGFIMRYPKEKENITGVHYEPWHYRYVGKEAAKEIMQKGVCLEEYLSAT
ncbi:MAG: M15 family metallopeptidase [Oscillospiraceae bacterium]|nr:M15 family metallopeptidase [Oscillospiraceae bacterium]